MRRSHHALKTTQPIECPNCGERKLPHHVCKSCGTYDGRDVVQTESRPELPITPRADVAVNPITIALDGMGGDHAPEHDCAGCRNWRASASPTSVS